MNGENNLNLGFTGPRIGMTTQQFSTLVNQIVILGMSVKSFHHGCCIGADEVASLVAKELNIPLIVGHPPIKEDYKSKAYYADREEKPKDYLTRDRDIVNASTLLLATPSGYVSKSSSGTWYTIRYAKKIGKEVKIILPDGKIKHVEAVR